MKKLIIINGNPTYEDITPEDLLKIQQMEDDDKATPPTTEELIVQLQTDNDDLKATLDTLLTDILPSLMT